MKHRSTRPTAAVVRSMVLMVLLLVVLALAAAQAGQRIGTALVEEGRGATVVTPALPTAPALRARGSADGGQWRTAAGCFTVEREVDGV